MNPTKYIWKNGKIINWEDAMTHVLSHGLHYGTSVFEGMRFYDSSNGSYIFRLNEHIDRLVYSADSLEMKIPYSKDELKQAVIHTCKSNEIKAGYIRPIIYCGYGKLGLSPKGSPIEVVIATWPWGAYLGEGESIKVKTTRFIRIHPKSLITDAKVSGHYVNSAMASLEANREGYDEALFLDYEGNVAEGPGENIFYVKNGLIYTVQLGNILPGITRDSIIEICKDLKLEIVEKTVTLQDLYRADEAFFTGTAAEVQIIHSLDDKIIGNGENKITKKIKEAFLSAVSHKNEKYFKWLTKVE